MWCPNCKNEYVPGITTCADCGIPLVDALEETAGFTPDPGTADLISAGFAPDDLSASGMSAGFAPGDLPKRESSSDGEPGGTDSDDLSGQTASPVTAAHAYVSQRTRAEDMKSTAYTFTLIGGAGLILLVLFAAGILPFHPAIYSKIMICLVMGAMFSVFLLVGIHSFRQIKKITQAADEEEALYDEIMKWFPASHTAAEIDAARDPVSAEGSGEEMIYFARYEVLSRLITERYPSLEESFLDHVIETLYAELF